jgi:hypothetical protein
MFDMKIFKLVFLGFSLFSAGALAQIPVTDVANLKQNVTDYLVTVKQLKADYEQITKLEDGIGLAFEQVQLMRGSRGMGTLANNEIYKKHRRQLPFENRYIVDRLARGKLPTNKEELSQGLIGLIALYQLHAEEENQTSAQIKAENKEKKGRATAAAALSNANAQLAMRNSQSNVETYEGLIDQIDQAADVKATQDLLARISAENGLVLNQLLNLEASQVSAESERSLVEDTEKRDVMRFGTFK